MKKRLMKYVGPVLSLLLLVGCAGNTTDPTNDAPVIEDNGNNDDPIPDDDPIEEEAVSFDVSISKEIAVTASYLDEVPYLSASEGNDKKGRSRPLNTDGIPQDEEGYYDITNPLPKYKERKWGDLGFVRSWYESFDGRLDSAKKLKDEVFVNCHSLNEWSNDRLMLFDPITKKLDFCSKRKTTIYSSEDGAHDYLMFDRGDIFKDKNGKINFRFSECEINLDIIGVDPIPHQNNVSYVEGSHYICSQTNRNYRKTAKEDGSVIYTLSSESMSALYIDLKNEGMVYHLGYGRHLSPDGKTWEINTPTKAVYDLKKRYSVDYFASSKQVALYDEDCHEALALYGGNQVRINLYDFDGWDSFFVRTLDAETNFDRLNDIKFNLSNGNVNNLNLHPDVCFRYDTLFDWEKHEFVEDYFSGNPLLYFTSPDFEAFQSYLESAGLSYKGDKGDLTTLEAFYADEIQHSFLGERLDTITDETLAEFVNSVCDNYRYPEIEEILNLKAASIPLDANIMEEMFKVENVIFDEKAILLSQSEILLEENPYLVPGQEYECSIELLDADETVIDVLSKNTFQYEAGVKIQFSDIPLEELLRNLDIEKHGQNKYYLALAFNGFRTILTFGNDKTKADVDFHDHQLEKDEEGNFQVFVIDKTLSIKAKEGKQFLIKMKCDTKIVTGDEIVIDEENQTVTYYCKECGEMVVFDYPMISEESYTDGGTDEEPPLEEGRGEELNSD